MKNLIYLYFVLCSFTSFSQDFPFPTNNTTWTAVEYGYGTFPSETGTWHFGIVGDTIVEGKNYSKIYVNNGQLGDINPESYFNYLTAEYYGSVREDSEQKVWYRHANDTTESLVYDFSLMVGDTFNFAGQPSGITWLPVESVDSILINGTYRKQIHFEYAGQQETWIEGIGSIVAPFIGAWSFIGNIGMTLNCFTQNEIVLYGDCDYPTGLVSSSTTQSQLKIYPNPTSTDLFIQIESLDFNPLRIEIFSIHGQQVFASTNFTENRKFEISELEKGVFVLILYHIDGRVWRTTFVKI